MTFFTLDDDEIPPDTREVLAASAALEITEFRLFELAYERWFGKPASTEVVEPVYTVYMFRERAPHWVRQYSREVIELARAGKLDPARFGVVPAVEDLTMYRKGIRLILVVTMVVVTMHVVAMLVAHY